MRRPHPMTDSWAVAEEIAAKDLNNLYLTSSYFTDPERYRAFCALYAVMRVVDDRIDDMPSRRQLTAGDRKREHAVVDAWHQALAGTPESTPTGEQVAGCDAPQARDLLHAASEAMRRFPVPFCLWDNFFAAMHQDIESPRFATYEDFLGYTEGASVAPTTIYLYLICASPAAAGEPYYPPPDFDLIACGRALGVFAYLGHILRDLTQDLTTGEEGLLYLAADDMRAHGVSEAMLRADTARKRASEPVLALVRALVERSRAAHSQGRELLLPLASRLAPDRAFIIELIVTIYERVIAKIAAHGYDPFRGDHRLTAAEKQRIVRDTAARVGYRLPALKSLVIGARARRARKSG